MTRVLEAGDICWVDLDPVRGTEQAGRRPAIILTAGGYNRLYPRSVICPITRNRAPWPTKVLLPESMKTQGGMLADQPRTVDRAERGFRFVEKAPEAVLRAVREIVHELLLVDHS